MTPAETLLKCLSLNVAADLLCECGDAAGELFAVLAHQGFALDTKNSALPDETLERARLIQASNHGLLRSKSRRWHKRRPPHLSWCRFTMVNDRIFDTIGGRMHDSLPNAAGICNCGAVRDVALYKLFRQIGDPTESPGRWVFDVVVSAEEPSGYIELRARDLDDPFGETHRPGPSAR